MKVKKNKKREDQKEVVTVELPIMPGVLQWVLDQYSEDQKKGCTEWVLVGKKVI